MPVLFFIAALFAAVALLKLGALFVMVTVLWTVIAALLGVIVLLISALAVQWRKRR